MTDKSLAGGCLCGAVRYKTSNQPVRVLACHCTTCKQRTGAPFGIGLYFNEADVEFTRGKMKTYEFHSDESGRWLRNEFCDRCGTTVSWTLQLRPGLRAIAGGTYDNPDWFEVKAHIWTRSARHDMCYADHVQIFEQALPAK